MATTDQPATGQARSDGAIDALLQEDRRDVWWHRALEESGAQAVEPERLDAEHPLFVLYTSGTTGKPKGMLHTTGGYLVGTSSTHKYIFD